MKTLSETEQNELNEMVQDFATDMNNSCDLLELLQAEIDRIDSTLTETELIEISDNEIHARAVKNLGIAEALEAAGL